MVDTTAAVDGIEATFVEWIEILDEATELQQSFTPTRKAEIRRLGNTWRALIGPASQLHPDHLAAGRALLIDALAGVRVLRDNNVHPITEALTSLSHPLGRFVVKTRSGSGAVDRQEERRLEEMERRIESLGGQVSELNDLLRSIEALLQAVQRVDLPPLEPR